MAQFLHFLIDHLHHDDVRAHFLPVLWTDGSPGLLLLGCALQSQRFVASDQSFRKLCALGPL